MDVLNTIPNLQQQHQQQQLCSSSLRHQLSPPLRHHPAFRSSRRSSKCFSHSHSSFVPVSPLLKNAILATMAPPSSKTIASTFVDLKRSSKTIASTFFDLKRSSKTVASTLADLKRSGKVALIPYITAGDPNLSTSAKAIKLLDKCGADIIELGVPYSDPLADCPVIQASAKRALKKGTNLDKVLKMVEEVVPQITAPIVLFSYYNPIMKQGLGKFFRDIKSAGVTGLIVPDIPLEETDAIRKKSLENGIELVLLTTPTTPKQRMQDITNATQGFLYLVSVTGVTGARAKVNPQVESLLQEIKQTTQKPVAVGFGISKPEHAMQLARWGADGVIIGSAMVKLLGESSSPKEGLLNLRNFAQDIKQSLLSL